MNDVFGKVISILLAVAVFFVMPMCYMQERMKSASQMYLLAECTGFIDSVCNTGFISRQMLQQFYRELGQVNGICKVQLVHETKELVYVESEDSFRQISTYHDESDIYEQLESGGRYLFGKNDFVKVVVCCEGGFSLFPWQEDPTQNVSYGGVVRYEAY